MQSFKTDKETWTLEVTYDSLRRVQADTGLDLTAPARMHPSGVMVITHLHQSVLGLLDVLWSLCRVRASEIGMKRPIFEAQLEGDESCCPLEEAGEKLSEELASFFLRNRRSTESQIVAEESHLFKDTRRKAAENPLSTRSANDLPASSA